MTTGFLWDEYYAWHNTGTGVMFFPSGPTLEPDGSAESPESKRRFRNLLDRSGLLERLTQLRPRPATVAEIARFHTPEYISRIEELSAAGGGEAGENTPFGPGSYEIALLAAGGCLTAVDAVLDGTVDNAYALVRPPGHHAEADRGRGYCIFANVSLAALHAREARGLERVAIIDWDVHHGNGTQDAFYDDPSVLTISLHQDRFYPNDSGDPEEVGGPSARGSNVNVALPPGSARDAYVAALERVVVPALRRHRPQLILVASGFDACAIDPLGRMMLLSEDYRRMTQIVMDAAAELCDGRLVYCHEGGYSTAYVPFCGLAVVEQLSGEDSGVVDPFMATYGEATYRDLQPHQDAAIARTEAVLAELAD